MKNAWLKKQFCMELSSPGDALSLQRSDREANLCIRGIVEKCQELGRTDLTVVDQTIPDQTNRDGVEIMVKREPVSGGNSQVVNNCHNCGNQLKSKFRGYCKAKSIICNNCSCRGHFIMFCKKIW